MTGMDPLNPYWRFVGELKGALFWVAVVAAIVCFLDWAARTRRISPFGAIARFFRNGVDPVLAPMERIIIRAGGRPSTTPWWSLVAGIVAALILITLLEFVGGIAEQIAAAAAMPQILPKLLLSWAIDILRMALLVRVIASWLPVSPRSWWIRWSVVLTEWMLAPLRRVVPLVGAIDITPLVAWILLSLLQRVLGIP